MQHRRCLPVVVPRIEITPGLIHRLEMTHHVSGKNNVLVHNGHIGEERLQAGPGSRFLDLRQVLRAK